jgi:hypothetical protein
MTLTPNCMAGSFSKEIFLADVLSNIKVMISFFRIIKISKDIKNEKEFY